MTRLTDMLALTALLAVLALGAALLSEGVLGLVPCALCLWERWPYRLMIGVGILGALWPAGRKPIAGLALVMALAGVGLGGAHVGVEQGWWPSPLPECAAPRLGHGTISERLARMPDHPSKPCDEPTFLIPGLPVSMAALNLLLALALSAGLATSLIRKEHPYERQHNSAR